MYDNNRTKFGNEEIRNKLFQDSYALNKVMSYHLKADYDNIKLYTINPKATTKIIQ